MRPGWIRTFSGKFVSLLEPTPEMICLTDIAHHLSLECRWGGATSRHYSVAEHSLWVADFVAALSGNVALALFHDAHEAYLKDVMTPLKVLLGSGYKEMADKLDAVIFEKFGVESVDLGGFVKSADKYAAWCEAKVLLAPCEVNACDPPPAWLLSRVPMLTGIRRPMLDVESEFLSIVALSLGN